MMRVSNEGETQDDTTFSRRRQYGAISNMPMASPWRGLGRSRHMPQEAGWPLTAVTMTVRRPRDSLCAYEAAKLLCQLCSSLQRESGAGDARRTGYARDIDRDRVGCE